MARLARLDFNRQLNEREGKRTVVDIDLDLIRDCIHCGLCLPRCPTFRALHHEGDSPRGRMWQIKEASLGMVEFDDDRFRTHIYQCFNCRACETACPSGVQFGPVMEMARGLTPPQIRRDRLVRAILLRGLLPHKLRLRLAGFLYRTSRYLRVPTMVRISGLWHALPLGKFVAFPPDGDRSPFLRRLPRSLPAEGSKRGTAAMLTGCIQDEMFHGTNRRTALSLRKNGWEVKVPKGQVCCGALASHDGEAQTAFRLAKRTVRAFSKVPSDVVVVNAAGCGSNMKEYELQLRRDEKAKEQGARFSERVRDACELLGRDGLVLPQRSIGLRVTYQDPCHLAHGQKVREEPRRLLQAIPGLELVEMAESDWCCGSAGVYNLTHPEIAEEALNWKLQHILATGAQLVASANPGCILQIGMGLKRAGKDIPVVHVLDLLGWAYGDEGEMPGAVRRALGKR